jgi:hypothetical protein
MSVRLANVVAAAIIFLVGLAFVLFSIPIYSSKIGGGPGAGVFPFWIGLVVTMAGLAYLRASLTSQAPERFWTASPRARSLVWVNALSMLAYVVLMPYLGFALATFLLLALHLLVVPGGRVLSSLLFAAVVSALISYCFEVWLYIPLPRGFIGW